MSRFKYLVGICFLIGKCINLKAQNLHLGAKLGFSVCFGYPVNRVGIEMGGFARINQVQSNFILHAFHCLSAYGPKGKRFELQLSENLLILFGPTTRFVADRAFLNSPTSAGPYKYSFGYGLKQYIDQRHTSQSSAMFHFTWLRFAIAIENDAFLFSAKDKFRTGSLVMQYQSKEFPKQFVVSSMLYSLKLQLYTTDVLGRGVSRIVDKEYPSRHGYFQFPKESSPIYSHGILSAGLSLGMSCEQNAFFQLGIDDERIRHVVQNKIIHDMPFLPKALDKAKNPHVPMLMANGESYLFKSGEKIRPSKLFMALGMNETLSY